MGFSCGLIKRAIHAIRATSSITTALCTVSCASLPQAKARAG